MQTLDGVEHTRFQSDQNQDEGGSVLPSCFSRDLFIFPYFYCFEGVGEIRRAKGGWE